MLSSGVISRRGVDEAMHLHQGLRGVGETEAADGGTQEVDGSVHYDHGKEHGARAAASARAVRSPELTQLLAAPPPLPPPLLLLPPPQASSRGNSASRSVPDGLGACYAMSGIT
eukprot:1074796-Rhodomonas_salina.3